MCDRFGLRNFEISLFIHNYFGRMTLFKHIARTADLASFVVVVVVVFFACVKLKRF